jgi:hypothetical protein
LPFNGGVIASPEYILGAVYYLQDVLNLFTASQPELTRSEISASLNAEGLIVSEDRLDRKLAALEANGKLVKLPATLTGEASGKRIRCLMMSLTQNRKNGSEKRKSICAQLDPN